jgi:DNA-directed RNA polymerase subunit L
MVKITNVSYDKGESKGLSKLELTITGPEINNTILNTIRRTILSDIPIFAWTTFKFTVNTSVFHNNFIKNQIKNIPVWGIENKIDFYEKDIIIADNNKEFDIEDIEDNVELNVDKTVNSTSLEQITMYVDYENKSNEIVSVTTDMVKFYCGKQIENPYPIPVQIVKLQPKQKIDFSVVSSIGIEQMSTIYTPVAICVCYPKDPPNVNEYILKLESRGQISEKRILQVAFLNIIKKLKNISSQLEDNDNIEGQIEINNEDHTIGNLISNNLQTHKNVLFAGYNMPHPLEKRVIISYKLKSGKIKETLVEVIEECISIFNKIDKVIESNKDL